MTTSVRLKILKTLDVLWLVLAIPYLGWALDAEQARLKLGGWIGGGDLTFMLGALVFLAAPASALVALTRLHRRVPRRTAYVLLTVMILICLEDGYDALVQYPGFSLRFMAELLGILVLAAANLRALRTLTLEMKYRAPAREAE